MIELNQDSYSAFEVNNKQRKEKSSMNKSNIE